MPTKELVKDQVILNAEQALEKTQADLTWKKSKLEEAKSHLLRGNNSARPTVATEISLRKEEIEAIEEKIVQLKKNLAHAIEDLDRRDLERSNAEKFKDQYSALGKEYAKLEETRQNLLDKTSLIKQDIDDAERNASLTLNEINARKADEEDRIKQEAKRLKDQREQNVRSAKLDLENGLKDKGHLPVEEIERRKEYLALCEKEFAEV